ncbi:MAG: hypothetical protein RQ743_06180 [Bacteroidales bacterium]|nr:hypothetical protein [Bacteroidales bacterium]
MKQKLRLRTGLMIFLSLLLFNCIPAFSQDDPLPDTLTLSQDDIQGLFDREEALDISIKFDVTEYMRKKPDEYMDAVITFYNDDDDSVSYDIRLRSRGERRREICAFPPIRLNFKNTNTIYDDIDSMTNIKMVTHCNLPSAYDDYVIKEYLIYKMYNLVTDYSFRVRLLRVNYIDTGKKGRFYRKYGFLIEPMNLLEDRLDVMELENIPLRYNTMVPDMLDRMAIFQYMIGNTDWQLITYHNMKVVKKLEEQLGIPIPYDFDYSGFINASYAVPHELFPIKDVRERFYMGPCRPDSVYKRILQEFMDNREAFYSVKDRCELISERTAKYVNDYLDGFFNLLEKDRLINVFSLECEDR